MNFEIKGLDSLFDKLGKLGISMEKAATDGMNKTLGDITADAKNHLKAVDTGYLRDSIEPYGEAHKAHEQGGTISGAVGTAVEHGLYIELGTGPVGEGTPVADKYPGATGYAQKGWTYYSDKLVQDPKTGQWSHWVHTRGQPAQPFLWPAYQAHAQELPENIKKAADKEVGKIVK